VAGKSNLEIVKAIMLDKWSRAYLALLIIFPFKMKTTSTGALVVENLNIFNQWVQTCIIFRTTTKAFLVKKHLFLSIFYQFTEPKWNGQGLLMPKFQKLSLWIKCTGHLTRNVHLSKSLVN